MEKEKIKEIKVMKRSNDLKILTSHLIKNLGEEGDEILINAMGIISKISSEAIDNSLRLFQEIERKKKK